MSKFSMGLISFVAIAASSVQGCVKAPTSVAKDIPVCSEAQLLVSAPSPEEAKAHRKFALPVVSYAYGTQAP